MKIGTKLNILFDERHQVCGATQEEIEKGFWDESFKAVGFTKEELEKYNISVGDSIEIVAKKLNVDTDDYDDVMGLIIEIAEKINKEIIEADNGFVTEKEEPEFAFIYSYESENKGLLEKCNWTCDECSYSFWDGSNHKRESIEFIAKRKLWKC